METSAAHFEELVTRALDQVPRRLTVLMDNVVVLIEDEPMVGEPDDLLGLYDGIPITERTSSYSFVAPDRIFIFKGPLLRLAADEDELVEEVRITVVHELAHHFGISDEQLHEWGWG